MKILLLLIPLALVACTTDDEPSTRSAIEQGVTPADSTLTTHEQMGFGEF